MALNITRGVVPKAKKLVVYGVEGVGKTTLASKMPDPLFIDTEGGSSYLDVRRLDTPKSWTALMQDIDEVIAEVPCSTLVIDTADWAERLCSEWVCKREGKASIEDFGYGKGYVKMAEEFGRLLDKLTDVTGAGMHVALLAHAEVRKFEEPNEASAYDRWELKLSKTGQKKIAPMVKEWADALLFLNYAQIIENVAKEGQAPRYKARGGKRTVYATHHACWDAKNRWGLPDEFPLSWEAIAPHMPDLRPSLRAQAAPTAPAPAAPAAPAAPPAPAAVPGGEPVPPYWAPLLQLMAPKGVVPEEVRKVAASLGHFTPETKLAALPEEYIAGFCVAEWPKLEAKILEMRAAEPVPFD